MLLKSVKEMCILPGDDVQAEQGVAFRVLLLALAENNEQAKKIIKEKDGLSVAK